MTLKQICGQLAGKPLSLDILLLFSKPQKFLHALCEVLDNWGGYDEDQGEYQPVYEEFGSILLLLLAFIYRYDLTPADLGIRSADSFVGKLWGKGQQARPLKDLTEQEQSRLGGWIHGLFDTEAGGLGDELMSSCPPQDFYLLMPTLFQQIVLALTTGYLTEEVLKGGLECKLPASSFKCFTDAHRPGRRLASPITRPGNTLSVGSSPNKYTAESARYHPHSAPHPQAQLHVHGSIQHALFGPQHRC